MKFRISNQQVRLETQAAALAFNDMLERHVGLEYGADFMVLRNNDEAGVDVVGTQFMTPDAMAIAFSHPMVREWFQRLLRTGA
jgi:hypothetical protein